MFWSNVGANFFTYYAQFEWGFFSLGQGDGCAELDRTDLEKT